ncbi:MAG: hypothetical protein Q4C58_07395 [Eubacteriales bacterium]|nr:hypothetical protein [Eubacteriales bacterium]
MRRDKDGYEISVGLFTGYRDNGGDTAILCSGFGEIETGISLLCGLALGTLSCIFYKYVMIVLTAVQGGIFCCR